MILKIKLKFNVIKILMKELNQSEMWAIYLMGLGQEIPDKVTKFDLIKIIHLLCKKLDWIDEDEKPMEEGNHKESLSNKVIEESKPNKTDQVIINNRLQTDEYDDQSTSVKIEGGHQTHSAAPDSLQTEEISKEVRKVNEDQVSNTAADGISSTLQNSTTITVGKISTRDTECLENETSTRENITDLQNDESELSFNCNLCNQSFSKERYLAAHTFMKHEDTDMENEASFSCTKCDKKFRIREELNTHEITHSENQQYSSKFNENFSREDMLRSHETTHAADHLGLSADDSIFIDNILKKLNNESAQESFTCKQCNKQFSSSQRLRNHERIHTTRGKLYHCSHCDYIATRPKHMQFHEMTHTGEFKCPYCDYRCSSANNLRLHIKTHLGKSLSRPQKSIHHLAGDRLDEMTIIAGNKPVKSIKCSKCDMIFTQYSELWKHKKQTHKEDTQANQSGKRYSCDICGQSFSFANSCKRHMRTHTNEKPYSCNNCKMEFRFDEELRRHSKKCKMESKLPTPTPSKT